MTKNGKFSPRERTAYHEAGHAVACYVLRQRFYYVTIKPDDETGSSGHLKSVLARAMNRWESSDGWPEKYRARLERLSMTSLAGVVAEGLMTGRHSWVRASGDLNAASFVLEPLTRGDLEEASRYRDWLTYRVRGILRPEHYQRAIKAVAHALLRNETVEYAEARAVIERAIPVTRLDVDFHEALAEAVAFAAAK